MEIDKTKFDLMFLREFVKRINEFNRFVVDIEPEAGQNINKLKEEHKNRLDRLKENNAKSIQKIFETQQNVTSNYEVKLNSANNPETLTKDRENIWLEYQKESDKIAQNRKLQQEVNNKALQDELTKQNQQMKDCKKEQQLSFINRVKQAEKDFVENHLNFTAVNKAYSSIYEKELFIENYQCRKENPENINIASIVYNIEADKLHPITINLLENYYPSLYRSKQIYLPYSLSFDDSFSFLFELNAGNKDMIVNRACALAMRLFMQVPPNKINFTFIDPVTVGGSFALFRKLYDENDPTKKVINGQIWATTEDIHERLKDLKDHISNVTQKYLKGDYANIQAYNKKAGKNAEAYQVLMIMDFPGWFNEESLRLLEQIISTGPKCGVFTVLFKSNEQIQKLEPNSKLKPLIETITNLIKTRFETKDYIIFLNEKFPFYIKPILPDKFSSTAIFQDIEERDKIFELLKVELKKTEKITESFVESIGKEIKHEDWFKGDWLKDEELRIPIGSYGAGNIQYLTFGINTFHAMIGGQIGSGKSTLLHTIIMSCLKKYSADEMQNIFD